VCEEYVEAKAALGTPQLGGRSLDLDVKWLLSKKTARGKPKTLYSKFPLTKNIKSTPKIHKINKHLQIRTKDLDSWKKELYAIQKILAEEFSYELQAVQFLKDKGARRMDYKTSFH
jgi:hypothetical protein